MGYYLRNQQINGISTVGTLPMKVVFGNQAYRTTECCPSYKLQVYGLIHWQRRPYLEFHNLRRQ